MSYSLSFLGAPGIFSTIEAEYRFSNRIYSQQILNSKGILYPTEKDTPIAQKVLSNEPSSKMVIMMKKSTLL